MPPRTRSRGVAPPSRVYHSTPTPAQAQFPPRRKVVRTYGKQNRLGDQAQNLRQQTLTQIDFVSSFEEDKDPIVLSSDSEDLESEDDEDKENQPRKGEGVSEEDVEAEDEEKGEEEGEEDEDADGEEPVSSGRKRRATSKRATASTKSRSKRRRTLSDKNPKPEEDNRRKTMGDAPSSRHRTQTLTQYLGRDTLGEVIKDSEDEDDEDEGNDSFENWLQRPDSPSPILKLRSSRSPLKKNRTPLKTLHDTAPESVRGESVVPQTPSRRPRQEIPSSNQTTPLSGMIDRYGAPNQQNPSPLKILSSPGARSVASEAGSNAENIPPSSPLSTLSSAMIGRYGPPNMTGPSPSQRKSSPANIAAASRLPKLSGEPKLKKATPKLVIEDTFATESWGSGDATPTPLRTKTMATPIRAKTPSADSSSLADEDVMETPTKPRRKRESPAYGDENKTPTSRKMKKVSPAKAKRVVLEIPDSDEDEEDFDVSEGEKDDENEGGFAAGPETQFVMNELASSEERSGNTTPVPTDAAGVAGVTQNKKPSSAEPPKERPLASSRPASPSPALPSSPPKRRDTRKQLRKPLQHPVHAGTHTQPFESQRVPLATLQALPSAGGHTDKLIAVPAATLEAIMDGFQVYLTLPSKVLHEVVRFWLFDGSLLRYMACIEPGERHAGSWRYYLTQVYELNNPLTAEDMREEGWIDDRFIPPAIVGQLLWNLRHAIFGDSDGSEETQTRESEQASLPPAPPSSHPEQPVPAPTPDLSVSQQVEAQLKSDIAHSTQFPTSDDILVPSTPDESPDESPKRPSPQTAIKNHHAPSYRASRPSQATTVSQASTPEKPSSSSASRPPLPPPYSSSSLTFQDIGDSSPIRFPQSVPLGPSSQLLSKSQMLPDSLIRDDARVPGEIWDSEEDVDERL